MGACLVKYVRLRSHLILRSTEFCLLYTIIGKKKKWVTIRKSLKVFFLWWPVSTMYYLFELNLGLISSHHTIAAISRSLMWMPSPPALLASLLLTLLLSLPKLRLAWAIHRSRTDIGLFNNIVALGLVVSGKGPSYPKLERSRTVLLLLLLLLCHARSGDPPWILKRAGLESTGRIASS